MQLTTFLSSAETALLEICTIFAHRNGTQSFLIAGGFSCPDAVEFYNYTLLSYASMSLLTWPQIEQCGWVQMMLGQYPETLIFRMRSWNIPKTDTRPNKYCRRVPYADFLVCEKLSIRPKDKSHWQCIVRWNVQGIP